MKLPETILITGANGQSAVHLAKELLGKGCKLLLIAHDRTDRIEQIVELYPRQCRLVKCDLNDFGTTSETLTRLINESGFKPDALVHTAAIRSYDAKTLAESDPAVWTETITKNINMAYTALRCVLPIMIEQKKGKIVLFGSNVTRTGLPFGSAYAAGKSALANLVRTVAWETAPHNVQVNMVSPAPLDTKLEEDYQGDYLIFRKEYFETYKQTHPANKLVSLEDVTEVVMSLLNLDTGSVSGEEVYLTGGIL